MPTRCESKLLNSNGLINRILSHVAQLQEEAQPPWLELAYCAYAGLNEKAFSGQHAELSALGFVKSTPPFSSR